MIFRNLLFLTLLTILSYNISAQVLSNPKIGVGSIYGGQAQGLGAELAVAADLSKIFTLNIRFSKIGRGLTRIGGGIEVTPITLGRFSPSIGLEYYYNSQNNSFFGDPEIQKFGNMELPIMLNYKISDKFDIGLGGALGSNNLIRLNTYYKF